jgi:EpsG family
VGALTMHAAASPSIAHVAAQRPRMTMPRQVRWAILVVACIILAGVAGVKPIGVSPDDDNYRIMFDSASGESWIELLSTRDAWFYVGSALFAQWGLGFTTFGIAWALATVALKLAALQHLRLNMTVLLLLYLSYEYWLHDYVQVRFGLALAMFLYAIYGRHPPMRWLMLLTAPFAHVTVVVAMAGYAAARWPARAMVVAGVSAVLTVALNRGDWLISAAMANVDVYLELMADGRMDQLNPLALMPMFQTLILLAMLPAYKRMDLPERLEFKLAVVGSVSFYALMQWPVFAFRFHEMFIVFFLLLCARMWNRSLLIKPLVLIYMLIGVRTVFLAQESLLFVL